MSARGGTKIVCFYKYLALSNFFCKVLEPEIVHAKKATRECYHEKFASLYEGGFTESSR